MIKELQIIEPQTILSNIEFQELCQELAQEHPDDYYILGVCHAEEQTAFEDAVNFVHSNLNRIKLSDQPVYLYTRKSASQIVDDIKKLINK